MPTPDKPSTPRVAHVVISLANGGLERLVLRWTQERNQRAPGSTLVYCLDELGELAGELPDGVVKCLHARRAVFPWDRRVVRRLHDWLMADGVNVVHSHNLPAQQYAALATSRTPVAHVYTQHGPGRHNLRFKNTLRSKILSQVTDRIVAVSHDTARCMHERYGVSRGRIEVVPNGIGPHHPASPERLAELRRELGLAENDFVLGSLGRLADVKGWDRFLPVFRELGARSAELGARSPERSTKHGAGSVELGARSAESGAGSSELGERSPESGDRSSLSGRLGRSGRSASGNQAQSTKHPAPRVPQLLLVGAGPEREAIERQAAALGLLDRVVFAGFQKQSRDYLDLMDVFVLPSYAEGLSVALLEAMAAGVPVVASDVGDNRAVVEPANAGLILEDDPGGWAASIARFVGDREGLCAAGLRGREHVLRTYTAIRTQSAYEAIYNSLLVKFNAFNKSLAVVEADGGRHKSASFGTGGRRGWRHPNLITQLRYHGITARLIPKWARAVAHRFLPPTERDTSLWMATYQNILRHAKPTANTIPGLKLGIVKDVMLRHGYYEAACLEMGVAYECVDLTADDWQSTVKALAAPLYLVRPFVLHSVGKALYEERLHVLTQHLQQKIFPGEEELWLYESKRRLAEWLAARDIPHPATHVFCDRDSAMAFADSAPLPVVFKADLGSESLGVQIVRTRSHCRHLVKTCFGRGYCQSRRDPRDRQWGFILFQEFIPEAREWRVVRIGPSFFAHRKGREGDFHSGSKLKIYDPPPRALLDLTRRVTDLGSFASMAVDILEDRQGNYLITEMQTYFGSINPYLMLIDGKQGRYLWHADSDDYVFEEGDFCRNNCCNLRVALVLEGLGIAPPMGWT